MTGLVCLLAACPMRTVANLSANHLDRLLFARAMAAADSGKFAVANLSLQTLINSYPNSKYARQAKIALQDPRIAQCGAGWNSSPACGRSP
jgi:outer membrane protein assembly factor BamD